MFDYKRLIWEAHHYRFGLAGEGQADTIQSYLDREPGCVLSIGCGPFGENIARLAAHASLLIGADREIVCIQRATAVTMPANAFLLVADAARLALLDAAVRHVVALGLFVHVKDTFGVLRELFRVCQPGGRFYVTNAVVHPKRKHREAAEAIGFRLVHEEEGYCPSASGTVKRRYLFVFLKE